MNSYFIAAIPDVQLITSQQYINTKLSYKWKVANGILVKYGILHAFSVTQKASIKATKIFSGQSAQLLILRKGTNLHRYR